jgi:hypothetical protein
MREIGQISLIQVQRSSLKVERGTGSYYDPTPLIVVEHLLLLPQGVIGVTKDGSQIHARNSVSLQPITACPYQRHN